MRKFVWLAAPALLVSTIVGCNKGEDAKPYADAEQAPAGHEEHAHHHEGPHGGHVVELSEDHSVHGEFVIDQEAKQAKFYLLGEDLKTPVEGTVVTLHATSEAGDAEVVFEPAGGAEAASEFTVALDQLPSSDIEALEGHFHVTADGKELSGDLAHDHGHDHEHEHEHAEGEEGHEHPEEEAPAPQ